MAVHSLKQLVIEEVSSCDKGAGEGVRILLMKRDGSGDDVVIDFNKMRAALTKRSVPLDEALEVLKACVEGIKADAAIIDKKAAVAESVKQFHEYVAGLPAADTVNMEKVMTPEQIAKQIADAVTAATAPLNVLITKLQSDAQIAAMPALTQSFYKALATDDLKAAFLKKDKAAQDKEACDADEDTKKRAAGDPVVKALTGEVESLKKRLAAADERDAVIAFGKQAVALGLPEVHGEVMRKAFAGDTDAIKKHSELIKGLTDQVKTGKVFAEFGSSGGTGVVKSAYDEIVDLAKAAAKTDKTTFEIAFDKVYNDPANVELMKRSKSEEMSKRQGIAA